MQLTYCHRVQGKEGVFCWCIIFHGEELGEMITRYKGGFLLKDVASEGCDLWGPWASPKRF